MAILLYLLLFFQILWCSFIVAIPLPVETSMANTILHDHLLIKGNNVIQTIWEQEPKTTCDIQKPSEKMLTDKQFLLFNFIPYLCLILYDASLRYHALSTTYNYTEINSGKAQGIIKEFSPNTFCQKMKNNEWFTTIEENKLWVSNFSKDMKTQGVCQRYCVNEIVNPICAYALWLDLSVKKIKSLHQLPLNAQDSHSLQDVLISPEKKLAGASIDGQSQVNNVHLTVSETMRQNVNTGNRRLSPSIPVGSQTFDHEAVTTKYGTSVYSDMLAHQHPPEGDIFVTSGQKQYFGNLVPNPVQTIIEIPTSDHMHVGISPKNIEQLKTDAPLAKSNDASLPVGNNPGNKKTSGPSEYPAHNIVTQDTSLSQSPKQGSKPDIKVPYPVVTVKSKQEEMNLPKKTQVVKESVSEPARLENTKASSTTLTTNSQQAAQTVPGSPVRANVGSSSTGNQGEYNTEGQKQVSGNHKTSANLDGYDSVGGDGGEQAHASNVASPGDSPKPSVPETSKIPVPSEDKTDKVRVNPAVPEDDTKEVPGSNHGELTGTKPVLDQTGKSEPEAANQAIESDDRVISGEPDDHEEQNAMDDGAVDSQVENGDTLGDHGGDQTQDRDDAGIDPVDQELATETHRYNEGDNDEPSRPDGSTKLSNNNINKDYLGGSDEDENSWSPAEQGRISINDAEGGYAHDRFVDAEDSHFFAYFMTMIVLCILGYLIFHNKQKILALALEGRVRKGTRRRPSTSGYRKLDSNLEEAVTSSCTGSSVTHVIY